MILLAIDSAGDSCSAALWSSSRPIREELLAFRMLEPARGQAERLIALVETVLADAGLRYDALGALAVNHGPGSFTGLRSAVAAARGLALAADLPVIAISGLEALAGAWDEAGDTVLAALDARRGEVYAQAFGPGVSPHPGSLSEPRAVAPQEAATWAAEQKRPGRLRVVGSGARLIQALLPADLPVTVETVATDARLVARCAARRLAAGERPMAGFALRPLYLRAPDARPPVPLVARHRALAAS